jgi:prolyl 4-hydroxylase
LTKEECQKLIDENIKSLTKATTLGTPIDSYRTADGTWIYNDTDISNKIKNIIFKETGIPTKNYEKVHIVKYEIGGEYKEHHDFFPPNTDYYEATIGTSGQRTHSFLFYLNDDFTGGETNFPTKKIKVTPRTGRMLGWSNTHENGELDYESLHAGLPVESGIKYIAIVWIRENQFGSTEDFKIETKNTKTFVSSNHFDLGQILTPTECEKIAEAVFDAKINGNFTLETDIRYYNNSLGGNVDLAWDFLRKYLPIAEKKLGVKLKEANPYIRIYRNGSTLNPHKDRIGLDWTVSVCLFSNIKSNWPLIVKNQNGKLKKYSNKLGYASLVSGNILEHWREPLKCNDGEYVIQMFLHYTQI